MKDLKDYSDLTVGHKIPWRNRTIQEIIANGKNYIVFIDDKDIICWDADPLPQGKNFGNVENQISFWESNCNRLFNKKESFDYKCLLAEGYARMLDTQDEEAAVSIIKSTSKNIEVEGEQILRQNYLLASFIAVCFVVLLLIIFVITKEHIKEGIYQIFLTGFFGGIGGFIFSMIRDVDYTVRLSYGKRVHQIDGCLRIVYGLFAGVIVALGFKAKIIFGFLDSGNANLYALYFLGVLSGASERLLPVIINQTEKAYIDKLNNSDHTNSDTAQSGSTVLNPMIKDITPKEGKKGQEIALEIVGTNFKEPKTVQLLRDSEVMICKDILSNSTIIQSKVLIDKEPDGKWDIMIENEDGKQAHLNKVFTILKS